MTKLRKPPGQRMINRMSTRTKWQLLTPLSLLAFVVGLCVFSEAATRRMQGAPTTQWALWGAYGLILIVGGLLLFGQAQRFRSQLDYRRFVRRELKKRDRGRSRNQPLTVTKQKSSPGRSEDR
ncbi:hypothetical protein HH216_18460 [Spirosoma rhododendri]|uniref:Uncharacterized protein n=2 Tax=Spirosoma rhododendri TaxID=2728024 RepID=A0A7L5DPW6_9BACT|nr:hypothetical protein HH216_18460 [Spirosoma rhododendri]